MSFHETVLHFISKNHFKNKLYHWQGKNSHGQRISGEIMAQSINLAMANLQKKGLQFLSLHPKRKTWLNKKTTHFDIILFFRKVAVMISAGIPISQAIHIQGQHTDKKMLLTITSSIEEDIHAGKGLAYAMRKFPAFFDEMTCNLLLTGEQSGTLDTMLERIAEHKERVFLLKNKIKQALFYPMVILSVAASVTILMLTCVIPRFMDLFQGMHARLPAFTLSVIHLADFLKNDWPIMLMALIVPAVCLYYAKRFPSVQLAIDANLLKMPLIGDSYQKFILAHFARSLATLFSAGISITEALNMLAHSTGNLRYRKTIEALHLHISAGKQLHSVMQHCTLFPAMMTQMIKVGEESGTLEIMLSKIADFYESDLDQMVGYLSRLLEPLIMVILGVVIGGLVIAMYLPVFKLGDVI